MNKKGQSAMEYLMTYGWAILVIIIVIAVLFYIGVLNPKNITPTSCTFPPGISCMSYKFTASSATPMTLTLGQATGHRIMVTGHNCTQQALTAAPTVNAVTVNISNGEFAQVAATMSVYNSAGTALAANAYNVGDTIKMTCWITYNYTDVSPAETHVAIGNINARAE